MKVSEMSKFIEKLQQVLAPPVQSMGFNHTKSEQARLKIQLVVNVNGGKAKSQIKEPAGADALVVSGTAIRAGETITGMRLANGDTE